MVPSNLVPFSLRIPPRLEARIEHLAGEARMSPRAFVRHLLEEATSERQPTPAAQPQPALPTEVQHRLAHAALFVEMAIEVLLPDGDDISPALHQAAAKRLSDLLDRQRGMQGAVSQEAEQMGAT